MKHAAQGQDHYTNSEITAAIQPYWAPGAGLPSASQDATGLAASSISQSASLPTRQHPPNLMHPPRHSRLRHPQYLGRLAVRKLLPSHQTIRRLNLRVLENLLLDAVPEGDYELIALPLKLITADASPVRAVLREL